MLPSTSPSLTPTSTIPSAVPSITGAVASVTISGTATEELAVEEIANITSELAEIYGVDPSEVETTVDYVASGTLDVTIPNDVSEEDAIAVLQDSSSDVLGVHTSDVVVTIEDDGTVSYSVTGGSYAEAEAIQNAAADAEFATEVTDDLVENGSTVTVESSTSNDDIEVVVSATVDTTDATGTVDPATAVADLTDSYGFTDSETEGNLCRIFLFQRQE